MAFNIVKNCLQCGKTFHTNRPRTKFCNWTCYQEKHKSQPVTKICPQCGTEFEPKRESANAKRRITFCSQKCTGKARTQMLASADYADRFWSKVEKTEGCWIWRGSFRSQKIRRGAFWIAGKRHVAYKVAYSLANNIQDFAGLFVCHKCNNPECVRPDHLYLGTHQDNMNDRKAAGNYRRKPRLP